MASFEELYADIEKRMIALGYEDFGELISQDHDINSLKLLKRRLMDEVKERRELKKERTKNTKMLRDFVVKVSRIFKKDMYIYNGIYVIPGIISQEDLKGKILLKINDEYIECVKKVLFPEEENKILYIPDISSIKALIDEFMEEEIRILLTGIERESIKNIEGDKYKKIHSSLFEELDKIAVDSNHFIPITFDYDDPDIIGLKKIFEIQYKDLPSIEVNLQLFPFVLESKPDYIELMSDVFFEKENEMTIYYARFKIEFGYFEIHMKIYYF